MVLRSNYAASSALSLRPAFWRALSAARAPNNRPAGRRRRLARGFIVPGVAWLSPINRHHSPYNVKDRPGNLPEVLTQS